MKLSRAERDLLMGVILAEEDRFFSRVETMLGVTWSLRDIVEFADPKSKADSTTPEKLPAKVRMPMLAAMAPEVMKAISDEYKQKYRAAMSRLENVPKGNELIDVGNLSPGEAKAFFDRILGSSPGGK